MKQTSGNKRKALAKNKGKGSEGLGIRSSKSLKNSKSQKLLSHYTEGKSDLLLSTRDLGSDNQLENGKDSDRVNPSATVWMGHLVQKLSDGYSRRDNFSNKSGADGDSVVVRRRARACLEASLPHNTGKH